MRLTGSVISVRDCDFQHECQSAFRFGSESESRGLCIIVSISADGAMIVEQTAECCDVVRTAWDTVGLPENFSSEVALIRRSDVPLI